MQDPVERLLNYRLDWKALFTWTLITSAFLLASLTGVLFLR